MPRWRTPEKKEATDQWSRDYQNDGEQQDSPSAKQQNSQRKNEVELFLNGQTPSDRQPMRAPNLQIRKTEVLGERRVDPSRQGKAKQPGRS